MIKIALGAWAGFFYWWVLACWLEVPDAPHPLWCIIFAIAFLAWARTVRWARACGIYDDYE